MPILTNNANFMPTTPVEAVIMGPDGAPFLTTERMAAIVEQTAADGISLFPVRSPLYSRLQALSAGATAEGAMVKAMHQSFIGQAMETPHPDLHFAPGIRQPAQGNGSLVQRKLAPLLMSEARTSLAELRGAATRLGRAATMTCTVFPSPEGNIQEDRAIAGFFPGNSLVQITADVLASMNIHPEDPYAAQAVHNALSARRYRAVLASFHMRRLGKAVLLRPNATQIGQYLLQNDLGEQPAIGEVHVEIARTDFANHDRPATRNSVQEAMALIEGGSLNGLPLGAICNDLNSMDWQGNVLLETTVGGIRAALKELGHDTGKANILTAHRRIHDSLRAALPKLT